MKTYGLDSLLNNLDKATRTPHAIRVKAAILRALAGQGEIVTVVRRQNEYVGRLRCVYVFNDKDRFQLHNTDDDRVMVEFHADEVYSILVYGKVTVYL